MPPNNPYIKLVKQDPDIMTDQDEIYARKGKWGEYFGNENPIVLEIGTGMGKFFGKQVGEHPEKNFIGMEIRYKRLFQSAEKARRATNLYLNSFSSEEKEATKPQLALSPLRGELERGIEGKNNTHPNFLMLKDFGQNIDKISEEGEVSETYIYFPDPWANKDRQKKHRIMQAEFLQNLYTITKIGGKVFFKTDHREYFDSSIKILGTLGIWKIECMIHNYEDSEHFDMKNITEFESFYRGEKTDIHYLELIKQ